MTAFLALGSNVGDRESHLAHALRELSRACELTGLSSVYESAPVGPIEQDDFLNLVVRVRTTRSPRELLDLGLALEAERMRERTSVGGPRTLDIDVILYDDREIHAPGLDVPHPRMTDRFFVLVPLLEIEPMAAEPGTGRRYTEYLEKLSKDRPKESGLRYVMTGEDLLDAENA